MSSLCFFQMKLRGKKENINLFFEALTQKNNVWMGRGTSSDITFEEDEKCLITGSCKNGLGISLIDNALSMRNHPEKWAFPKEVKEGGLSIITLIEACEKYSLEAEAFSEVSEENFQEYFHVDENGCVLCKEVVEYSEYDLECFETKEEAESELYIGISDEEWKERNAVRGGFRWDFSI